MQVRFDGIVEGRRVALLDVAQRAALGKFLTPSALEAAVHDMAAEVQLPP